VWHRMRVDEATRCHVAYSLSNLILAFTHISHTLFLVSYSPAHTSLSYSLAHTSLILAFMSHMLFHLSYSLAHTSLILAFTHLSHTCFLVLSCLILTHISLILASMCVRGGGWKGGGGGGGSVYKRIKALDSSLFGLMFLLLYHASNVSSPW
jgi:hypothetical protein